MRSGWPRQWVHGSDVRARSPTPVGSEPGVARLSTERPRRGRRQVLLSLLGVALATACDASTPPATPVPSPSPSPIPSPSPPPLLPLIQPGLPSIVPGRLPSPSPSPSPAVSASPVTLILGRPGPIVVEQAGHVLVIDPDRQGPARVLVASPDSREPRWS